MTYGSDDKTRARECLREELRQSLEGLPGIYPVDRYTEPVRIGTIRRKGGRTVADPTRSLTLVEDENGVLLWEDGAILPRPIAGLRRGYRGSVTRGDVVEHVIVEPLEPSEIAKTLNDFDARLTPHQGLRRFAAGKLQPPNKDLKPVQSGSILLFIHGTFSQTQAILDQMANQKNKLGRALLDRAARKYDQILAFDHPTLSVSPMLNALDLARRLEGSNATIDVICHSRGGLVCRWWMEAFDRSSARRRAVLVGAPLEGTSLAAPPHLRHLLSWFSNLNKVIGAAASTIPFLTVVSCLARLTATITSLAARTPLVDAAVAMVPGLAAMSRISNGFELNRLNTPRPNRSEYYAIKSQFEPSDPHWKFWEYFVNQPIQRAAYSLFPGANDLVVDTDSMTVLESAETGEGRKIADIIPERVYNYGATNTVYHTNYFGHSDTCDRIAKWLQI